VVPIPSPPAQHPVFTSAELRLVDLCRLLAQAEFDVGPARPIRRRVLDTFDGRLHAAGLQLEFREVPEGELVLVGGGPIAARVSVERAPTFAADLPPGAFSARLAPLLEVRALLPKLEIAGNRAVAVRRDGADKVRVAVVVHDGVSVNGKTVDTRTCMAEVQAMEGYPKAAERASTLLSSFGLHRHSTDMLSMLAEHAGVDVRGYAGSPTVALARDEAAFDGFRRVLANLADAMAANWAGTVDDVDSEFLHDLRVAVRRTRSVLSEAKRVLPDDVRAHHRSEFRWLGTVTSPARDLDVYMIEWDGYVGPLGPDVARALRPVIDHIARQRDIQHVALAEALRSARYGQLMTEWRAWLNAGDPEELLRDARRPLGAVAGRRIAVAQAQLLERGRSIGPESPAEELHELRKDAKRLRYLLECFGGVLSAGPRKAFVQRLKALQDNLGEHQDTEVHSTQLRTFATDLPEATPETLVAIGQLTERFELRRQEARGEFARRFAAYDTTATARTLETALRAAAGR